MQEVVSTRTRRATVFNLQCSRMCRLYMQSRVQSSGPLPASRHQAPQVEIGYEQIMRSESCAAGNEPSDNVDKEFI